MIVGLLMAIIAGTLVSLQNIFNSKVNEHLGTWRTTTLVLGLGFLASLSLGLLFQGKQLFVLENMKLAYWFSGIMGVGIISCLVQAIKWLGPTFAISIVLSAQLLLALLFDTIGLFGLEKVPFTLHQLIGVLMITAGIVVFKMSAYLGNEQSVSTAQNS